MHTGFPVTNFLDLVSLKIRSHGDGEEALFPALPLMKKLQTLDLVVHQGWLLRSLPQSLREVALEYLSSAGWDDRVIPALQQLLDLEELKIKIQRFSEDTLATLSSDLRPFLALQRLSTFRVRPREAWTPGALRALGEFQDELVRSASVVTALTVRVAADLLARSPVLERWVHIAAGTDHQPGSAPSPPAELG